MKCILFNKIKNFFLQTFQVIPEKKTQGNLINYLIFMIKEDNKNNESKIVKKCLRWVNLIGSFKR